MKCPNCNSNRIVIHQHNVTKHGGERTRYKCQKCGSTFYKMEVKA